MAEHGTSHTCNATAARLAENSSATSRARLSPGQGLPPSDALTIAYLYFKLGMSQLAIAGGTGRSWKAVRRTVRLFGRAIENRFRSFEARGRG